MADNITWHEHAVSREERCELLGAENRVYWFTGLSGSGKSTLANAFARRLHDDGVLCFVLDGDNVRHGLNSDLGFSVSERAENIRRVAHVAKLLYDAGVTVLVAFISPYREDRAFARGLVGDGFVEVFVDTPLQVCEERDVKGLYAKARAGEIQEFTGISAPFETPLDPELRVDTSTVSIEQAVSLIRKVEV